MSSNPQHPCQKLSLVVHTYNHIQVVHTYNTPITTEWRNRDRQTPEALWVTSLAESVSLSTKVESHQGKTPISISSFHRRVCAHTYTSKYIYHTQIQTKMRTFEIFKAQGTIKLAIVNANSKEEKPELVRTEASNCTRELPSSDQLAFVSSHEVFRKLVLNYK